MLGAILAGAALGAASLIILNGRQGPRARPAPAKAKDKDGRGAEHR
jgi:hypothetical protein